jgi:uncharacterized membrane protein YhaH (DUF805 family)
MTIEVTGSVSAAVGLVVRRLHDLGTGGLSAPMMSIDII